MSDLFDIDGNLKDEGWKPLFRRTSTWMVIGCFGAGVLFFNMLYNGGKWLSHKEIISATVDSSYYKHKLSIERFGAVRKIDKTDAPTMGWDCYADLSWYESRECIERDTNDTCVTWDYTTYYNYTVLDWHYFRTLEIGGSGEVQPLQSGWYSNAEKYRYSEHVYCYMDLTFADGSQETFVVKPKLYAHMFDSPSVNVLKRRVGFDEILPVTYKSYD